MMANQGVEFSLSADEQIVRTYECTRLPKLFSAATIGYLTVTNKRLVYHACSESTTSSSVILAEMPVEDVAGVSTSLSVSYNWLLYVGLVILLHLVSSFVERLLPPFLTGWVVSFLLVLPYAVLVLFRRNILSEDLRRQVLETLRTNRAYQALKRQDPDYCERIFRVLFQVGVVFCAWNLAFRSELGGFLGGLLLIGAYVYVTTSLLGRHRSFSLSIASRAARASGITISGGPFGLMVDSTASRTLAAGPARDAELVIRDLGAMLNDIRLLGDLGVAKWKS